MSIGFLSFQVNYLYGRMLHQPDEASACRWVLANMKPPLMTTNLARITSWKGTFGDKIVFDNSRLQQAIFCKCLLLCLLLPFSLLLLFTDFSLSPFNCSGALIKKWKKSDLTQGIAAMQRWFNTSAQRKPEEEHD